MGEYKVLQYLYTHYESLLVWLSSNPTYIPVNAWSDKEVKDNETYQLTKEHFLLVADFLSSLWINTSIEIWELFKARDTITYSPIWRNVVNSEETSLSFWEALSYDTKYENTIGAHNSYKGVVEQLYYLSSNFILCEFRITEKWFPLILDKFWNIRMWGIGETEMSQILWEDNFKKLKATIIYLYLARTAYTKDLALSWSSVYTNWG